MKLKGRKEELSCSWSEKIASVLFRTYRAVILQVKLHNDQGRRCKWTVGALNWIRCSVIIEGEWRIAICIVFDSDEIDSAIHIHVGKLAKEHRFGAVVQIEIMEVGLISVILESVHSRSGLGSAKTVVMARNGPISTVRHQAAVNKVQVAVVIAISK